MPCNLSSEDVAKMFNSISKDYDFLNNVMSFGRHYKIKQKALNRLPLNKDSKVLDLCTGTGDLAIILAQKGIQVTGIDFSSEMLKIAREKAKNLENITFMQGNVLDLPFEDGTFDACTISFGLRNIDEYKKCLLEMKRVTKKGGFISNLETGKPNWFINLFYYPYFHYVVPFLGKVFHGNKTPYTYLPSSVDEFPSQDELVKIFKELGFEEVKNYNYVFGAIAQQIAKV